MMMIRFSRNLSALLFCLPMGLCVAVTARAAADDDDEEWHETTGSKTEKSSTDDTGSIKHADKAGSDSSKGPDKEGEATGDTGSGTDSTESDAAKKRKNKSASSPHGPSLALLGSYGFRDPLAPGLGLRAGTRVETALPLYFGAVGQYFFGTTTVSKDLGTSSDYIRRFVYLGGEAGVDVEVAADILLRPYAGLGFGLDVTKICDRGATCKSDSKLHATLTPGIVGLYQMGTVFVGVDLRFLIVTGASTTSGPVVSATIGLNF